LSLSCCSSYEQCSKAGTCINKNSDLYQEFYSGCNYSRVLESGRNFFSKKENGSGVVKTLEIKKSVPAVKKQLYLSCLDRLFAVYRRNKVGMSYTLKAEELEAIEKVFQDNEIPYVTEKQDNLCVIESGYPEAKFRVWVEIGEGKYNILNFNSLLLTEENCKKIANAFTVKGIFARVECMGIRGNYNAEPEQKKPEIKAKPELTPAESIPEKPEEIKKEIPEIVRPEKKTQKLYVITKDGQECLGLYKSLEIVREIVNKSNEKLKSKKYSQEKYGYKEVYGG
jgi:hypothetical protein